ncbi:putative sodium dependent ion transport protein [Neisseria gonorrhoeae]|uniref:Putative sodium dependent ion transport protein n=1 Tax=Neisseria gonorrhoeae TaxID=485 RepID=A0A378VTR4_NEIGO|nr:putative sodium dependent ion transport protein [Neisseria gonorrhoeae]
MKMPFGTVLFAVFMLLVVFATLTSAFSMLETVIASTIRQDERKRKNILGLSARLFSLSASRPRCLSAYGVSLRFRQNHFDLWDYVISAVIMPIGALSVSIFTAWIQDKQSVLKDAGAGSTVPRAVLLLWLNTLRYLAPIAIIIVFVNF